MKRILYFFLPFLLLAELTFAQKAFIREYSTKEGFPTKVFFDVCKSSDGLMWFSSEDGLIRFDGKNVRYFNTEDGLSDLKTQKIKEDFEGRLWFINENGTLNYYYHDTIYNETNNELLQELNATFPYTDFFQDNDSVFYFYNINSEIYVVKNYKLFDYFNIKMKLRNSEVVLFYMNKSAGGEFSLWTSKGIYYAKNLNDSLNFHDFNIYIERVFPLNNEECITVERNGYLNHYKGSTLIRWHFAKLKTAYVFSMIKDKEGRLWIGTRDYGIYVYTDNGPTMRILGINGALRLFQDEEDNIWVTSFLSGVYQIKRYFLDYRFFDTGRFNGKGIRGLGLSNIGGVWATNGSNAYLVKEGDVFELPYSFDVNDLDRFYHFKNNTLLINGKGTEFYRFHNVRLDNQTKTIQIDNPKKYNYKIKNVLVNKSESKLYSYLNNFFYNINTSEFNGGIIDLKLGLINNIFFDRNENVIINTVLENVTLDSSKILSAEMYSFLDRKNITCHVRVDQQNDFFSVDRSDIFLLHKDQYFNLTEKFKSQVNFRVREILYEDSTLFFSSSRAIYYIKHPLKVIQGESLELNMLDVEFNMVNDILCYDSSLYIASDDGITILPLNAIKTELKIPPKPFIEQVQLNDLNIGYSNNGVEYTGLHKLSINFSSLNFSSLSSVYSYKLEGYDKTWTEGYGLRAIYSNLPPGNYTFKLLVRKIGEISTDSTELSIRVKPTLFQRTITWILIGALVVFIAIRIVITYKNSQLKKKETESMMLTLEHKALLSMMNPHFIFNALGSIQNYLLLNKAVEAGTYLAQFARLIRQNMNSIKTNFIFLEEEIDRLRNYLDLEKLRTNNKFSYQIIWDDDIDIEDVSIPSMVIQPFVENAIWHGVTPLEANDGEIKVIFEKVDDRSIKVTVEDNGIGIKKDKEKTNRGGHLNIGMNLTEKRLSLIAEKYQVQTKIVVEELMPGNINPGTKVTVIIPVFVEGFEDQNRN